MQKETASNPSSSAASTLPDRFLFFWRLLDGPQLEREYRFCPQRRWRFDLAHPATKVAVELHGGIWQYGRHNHPSTFPKDREKINAAVADGWRVFEFVTSQINYEAAAMVLNLIERVEKGEFK
jgi:very-short-patch-repair endonuclease